MPDLENRAVVVSLNEPLKIIDQRRARAHLGGQVRLRVAPNGVPRDNEASRMSTGTAMCEFPAQGGAIDPAQRAARNACVRRGIQTCLQRRGTTGVATPARCRDAGDNALVVRTILRVCEVSVARAEHPKSPAGRSSTKFANAPAIFGSRR